MGFDVRVKFTTHVRVPRVIVDAAKRVCQPSKYLAQLRRLKQIGKMSGKRLRSVYSRKAKTLTLRQVLWELLYTPEAETKFQFLVNRVDDDDFGDEEKPYCSMLTIWNETKTLAPPKAEKEDDEDVCSLFSIDEDEKNKQDGEVADDEEEEEHTDTYTGPNWFVLVQDSVSWHKGGGKCEMPLNVLNGTAAVECLTSKAKDFGDDKQDITPTDVCVRVSMG